MNNTTKQIKQTKSTWDPWSVRPTETFAQAMATAASKAGASTAGLHIMEVTVDRTWGHLSGFAFVGPAELVERAAKFCAAYHSHTRMPGTYAAQNASMDRGVMTVYVDVKTLQAAGIKTTYQQGNEALTARVVSTVYYAGAE